MVSIWFENNIVKPKVSYDRSVKTLRILKKSLSVSAKLTLILGMLSLLLSPPYFGYGYIVAFIFTVTFILYYSISYVKVIL